MGRVKAWAETEFQESLAIREKEAGFDDSDAPSPSWELEFNDWLDRYEASFGDNL